MTSQQIRPTAAQLNAEFEKYFKDQGFDGEDEEREEGEATSSDEDGGFDWPPAATVKRSKPPTIGTRSNQNLNQAIPISEGVGEGEGKADESQQSRREEEDQQKEELPSTKPTQKVLRFSTLPDQTLEPDSEPEKVHNRVSAGEGSRPPISTSSNRKPSRFAQQRAQAQLHQEREVADNGSFSKRANVEEKGEEDEEEMVEVDSDGNEIRIPPIPRGSPVVGGVRERPTSSKTNSERSSQVVGAIRERASPLPKDPNPFGYQGFPQVSQLQNVTSPTSFNSQEVWLDEDEQPISAFRKSRLIKQGLGPPNQKSNASSSSITLNTSSSNSTSKTKSTPSVLSSLAAPIKEKGIEPVGDDMSSLMKSISDENDRKLKAMNQDQLEEEVESIQNLFGADVMDLLLRRGEEKFGSSSKLNGEANENRSDGSKRGIELHNLEDPSEIEHEEEGLRDPSRDPGGGADPADISRMLQSVSRENDEELRHMDMKELEEEKASLQNLFGEDVMEMLRKRGEEGKKVQVQDQDQGESSQIKESKATKPQKLVKNLKAQAKQQAEDEDFQGSSKDIRERFFPQEVESNPSLEWTKSAPSNSSKSDEEFRFDFNGKAMDEDEKPQDRDSTYLAGLHHHGESQSSAGYTLGELLNLTRSTVGSQRSLAFLVLGRICIRYPSVRLIPKSSESKQFSVARFVDTENLRPKVSIMARWLLEDRQRNVASSALGCLRATMLSDSSGPSPFQCVDSASLFSPPNRSKSKSENQQFSDSSLDWISQLIKTGLIKSLNSLTPRWSRVGQRSESDSEEQAIFLIMLDILLALASRSIEACQLIMQEKRLIDVIVGRGIKPAWPAPNPNKSSTPIGPNPSAVKLITVLLSSSRDAAERLVHEGAIESLMRILTLFPWMMEKGQPVEDRATQLEWKLVTSVLETYTALGKYGMFSPIYMRIAILLTPMRNSCQEILQEAIDHLSSVFYSSTTTSEDSKLIKFKLDLIKQLLLLVEGWTASASDPEAKDEVDRVVWQQVSDWSDLSSKLGGIQSALISLQDFSNRKIEPSELGVSGLSILHSILGVASSSILHFSAYVAASKNWASQQDLQALSSSLPDFRNYFYVASSLTSEIYRITSSLEKSRTSSEPFWAQAQSQVQLLVDLCDSATAISSFKFENQIDASHYMIKHIFERTAKDLLAGEIWEVTSQVDAVATGSQEQRSHLVDFVTNSLVTQGNRSKERIEMGLAILGILQPGDEGIAKEILENIVGNAEESLKELKSSYPSSKIDAQILMPFFQECLRSQMDEEGNPTSLVPSLRSTPKSMRSVKSLFYKVSTSSNQTSSGESESNEEGSEEEKKNSGSKNKADIDPLTGASLWRSPASGLPMRRDWPLLALDDLLESADSAALNRSGNLPSDWNSSEEEIVRSSLALASVVFSRALSSHISISLLKKGLPSSSDMLFSLMKVYRLEESQAKTPGSKATGNLTGKDLFREPVISSLISKLFNISKKIASISCHGSTSIPTLEEVSIKSLPNGIPFYQFYTDLLGLYDSISFGDDLFGRIVLSPTSMRYPVDYRKLLWDNYVSSIKTIRCKISESPSEAGHGIWEFLEPVEKDDGILRSYLNTLLSEQINSKENQLLYNIAVHHLVASIWPKEDDEAKKSGSPSNKSRHLAQSLFVNSPGFIKVEALLYDGRRGKTERKDLKMFGPDDEEIKQRLSWVAQFLGEGVARELRELTKGRD